MLYTCILGIEKAPEKKQLQQLLQHPRVALGEIGLDWTEPMHTWDLQLTVFRRLLSSSCTRRPLVLHLRDGRQQFSARFKIALKWTVSRQAFGFRKYGFDANFKLCGCRNLFNGKSQL